MKLSKTKTRIIGTIALTALLLAVPAAAVFGEQEIAGRGDIPEVTPWTGVVPVLIGTPYTERIYVQQIGLAGDGVRTEVVTPWTDVPPAPPPPPADDVGIAIPSSGIQPPYRSGLNAHGRAWTRAHHQPGVLTEVVVDVWLWWWDGAKWRHVGTGFDSETEPCWRGLITASGLAINFNASTGWYVVTSLHRVYVGGVRVYEARRQSESVWLTFP